MCKYFTESIDALHSANFFGCFYKNWASVSKYVCVCLMHQYRIHCLSESHTWASLFVLSGKWSTLRCETQQWFTRWRGWGEDSLPTTEAQPSGGEHGGIVQASGAALLGRVPLIQSQDAAPRFLFSEFLKKEYTSYTNNFLKTWFN